MKLFTVAILVAVLLIVPINSAFAPYPSMMHYFCHGGDSMSIAHAQLGYRTNGNQRFGNGRVFGSQPSFQKLKG